MFHILQYLLSIYTAYYGNSAIVSIKIKINVQLSGASQCYAAVPIIRDARRYKNYYMTYNTNRILQLTRILSSVRFHHNLRPLSTAYGAYNDITHRTSLSATISAAADEHTNSHRNITLQDTQRNAHKHIRDVYTSPTRSVLEAQFLPCDYAKHIRMVFCRTKPNHSNSEKHNFTGEAKNKLFPIYKIW